MLSQRKINGNSVLLHVPWSMLPRNFVLFLRERKISAFMACEKDIIGQNCYIKKTFITIKRHLITKKNILRP